MSKSRMMLGEIMILNYLKVLVRSLYRQKVISLINLLGLAIAVACTILIYDYILFEFTYDGFHNRSEDIYLVNRQDVREGRDPFYNQFHNTSINFKEAAENSIPEIEIAARVTDGNSIIRNNDELLEYAVLFVDSEFFSLFDFPLVDGDQSKGFTNINSIVVTHSLADHYFPDESPIGKMLDLEVWGEFKEYMISGVVDDLPGNTRFTADLFIPFKVIEDYYSNLYGDLWNLGFSQTYLRLTQNTDAEKAEERILTVMDDLGITTYWGKFGTQYYHLQPLLDVHICLKNDRGFPVDTTNQGVTILFSVGVIILLIAVINYTTLSAGRSNVRWREIGLRKVLGAAKQNLKIQFWFETFLLVMIAVIFGVVISELTLPLFSRLSDTPLSNNYPVLFVVMGIITLLLTLCVGVYPVNILTSFPIHTVFRGTFKYGSKGTVRKILVFIQFSMSIALIVATITMSQQLIFIQDSNLGMDKEYLLEVYVPNQDDSGVRSLELLRDEFKTNPAIKDISAAACSIGNSWIKYEWNVDGTLYSDIYANTVDFNYLNTMGIKLLHGRNFSREMALDADKALIVNEAFVEAMGWDDAIGKTIPGNQDNKEIIGVVENYVFLSMHHKIYPMVLSINPDHLGSLPDRRKKQTNPTTIQRIYFRVSPGSIAEVLPQIRKVWKEINPDVPFDFSFFDEIVDQQYQNDQKWRKVIFISAILAILLATFGLISHTIMEVSHRTKEIGIRKVLGATPTSILGLIGKEITWIVLLSNLVAWPIAYFSMKKWLELFAHRIDIGLLPFLGASLIVLVISWLITGTLAQRTANMNPVLSLRREFNQ